MIGYKDHQTYTKPPEAIVAETSCTLSLFQSLEVTPTKLSYLPVGPENPITSAEVHDDKICWNSN